MLAEDGLTGLLAWPLFPDPSSPLPLPADHQCTECLGVLPAFSDLPLDNNSPIEQSAISQDEIYFEQFLSVLYEEITVETEQTLNQGKRGRGKSGTGGSKQAKHGPALSSRFHKCLCAECLACGTWRALPNFISTRLPFSGLQIDVFGHNSVHLCGHFLSLLVSLDETRGLAPTVAIIFHNQIKVLIRHFGNNKRQLTREVDIICKPYTVAFRANSVSFTSDANVLTYCIDKNGCKTKICKHNPIGQEDIVTKLFHQELSQNRTKWRSLPRHQNEKKAGWKTGKVYKSQTPMDLLQKCRRLSSPAEGEQLWSIGDCLTIKEQSNGSLFVKNEESQLYLSVHSQNHSLCLQLASLCIILNKSGHMFVAHHHKNSTEETLEPINGSREMNMVRQDIELLSQASLGSKTNRTKASNQDNQTKGEEEKRFSISRAMNSCEQFAMCGVGGLLVKHHHRRAGLNQRNLICLL